MFATISDPFVDHNAQISIYDVPEDADPSSYPDSPRVQIDLPKIDGKRVSVKMIVGLCLSLSDDI